MTDIELLPLHLLEAFSAALKGERGELDAWLEVNNEADVRLHVDAYARACVAHATAAKDAEIEKLRVRADAMAGEAIKHEARAERLAEAIKAYKSECDNPAKDYVLRAKRRDEMFALLHGHDQEVGNG